MIAFTHIPKAAGTSLRYVIRKNSKKTLELKGYDNANELVKFQKNVDKNKYTSVIGHMPHGFVSCDDFQHITLLRNPVDRVISNYNYILNSPHHYLFKRLTQGGDFMSFKDFVTHPKIKEGQNLQTRFLGSSDGILAKSCDDTILHLAKSNLKFYHFGFVEKYKEFLDILKFNKLINNNFSPRFNTTKYSNLKYSPSKYELELCEEVNHFDCELYEFAMSLYIQKYPNVVSFDIDKSNFHLGDVLQTFAKTVGREIAIRKATLSR